MSSQRKIDSARANGARSKGPVTPEGKLRSSRNALRHGLLADQVVLPSEDRASFLIVVDQHFDRFQPTDGVEYALVEEMAAAYWRLRRTWTTEKRLLSNQKVDTSFPGFAANAFLSLAAGPELPLLHRYETRLHNMYRRAINTFQKLRETRVPNEPNPDFGHWRTAPGDPQTEPDQPSGVDSQNPGDAAVSTTNTPRNSPPEKHQPAAVPGPTEPSSPAASPTRVHLTRNAATPHSQPAHFIPHLRSRWSKRR